MLESLETIESIESLDAPDSSGLVREVELAEVVEEAEGAEVGADRSDACLAAVLIGTLVLHLGRLPQSDPATAVSRAADALYRTNGTGYSPVVNAQKQPKLHRFFVRQGGAPAGCCGPRKRRTGSEKSAPLRR